MRLQTPKFLGSEEVGIELIEGPNSQGEFSILSSFTATGRVESLGGLDYIPEGSKQERLVRGKVRVFVLTDVDRFTDEAKGYVVIKGSLKMEITRCQKHRNPDGSTCYVELVLK